MMEMLDRLEEWILGPPNSTDNGELDDWLNVSQINMSHDSTLLDEIGNRMWRDVILLVAYGILIIISLFGNILVCHVVLRNRRMHTVTNFFIANLAISDLLLTCINVPFNIARNLLDEWPFGSVMCHLLNFSLMVSVYVSTFTLMGIALDRHQVLLYPLSPRMSKPVGLIVLGLIWAVAVALSLPFGIYNKVQPVDFLYKRVERCTPAYPYPKEVWDQYLTVITLVFQYIIPLAIIAFTYGRIVRKLWVRTHVGAVTQNQQVFQQKAKRKSIKLLIIVVVVFALCWMPLNLYQVLADIHPNVKVFHYNTTVFFICHWIAISSTCYNPFLYCWLNETFRAEVKARFTWCCLSIPKRVHPGTEINGTLLRSDRAYLRRQSKSSSCTTNVKTSKTADKYKLELDVPTREQSESLTEHAESPNSDSLSTTVVSGVGCFALKPLPEMPEHAKGIPEVNEQTMKNHVGSQESKDTHKVTFMI